MTLNFTQKYYNMLKWTIMSFFFFFFFFFEKVNYELEIKNDEFI